MAGKELSCQNVVPIHFPSDSWTQSVLGREGLSEDCNLKVESFPNETLYFTFILYNILIDFI